MGHAAKSEFKAQMDLGTTVPYISAPPPKFMPDSREESRNPKGTHYPRSLTGGHLGGFRNPLMRSQKARYIWLFGSIGIITWWFMN